MVLAALVGAADLLLLVPVRFVLRWGEGEISLTARAGPVPVKLLPRERERRAALWAGRDARGLLRRVPAPLLRAGVRWGLRTGKRLCGRICLTGLRVRFVAGGDDPYRTAMAYGRAALALEGIGRLWADAVPEAVLRAEADFGGRTRFDAEICAALRLGYLLGAAGRFCFAILREYYRYKTTEG